MSLTALASPSPLPMSRQPSSDDVDDDDDADAADLRVVRFHNECVLIPEKHRKRTRLVTRSYSLPLWKRRSLLSDSDPVPPSPVPPTTPEDAHIILKVPLPSFIVWGPRPPKRGLSPSASPQAPLSPCLVHRSPSSSPPLPTPPKPPCPTIGKSSLPSPHPRKSESIVTVPLRACCPNCVPITEESMREGEQWKVRFTRGARRRRSASLDSTTTRPPSRDGFTLSHDAPSLARYTITVDEVDKRQRSLDFTEEPNRRCRTSLHPPGYMDAKFPTSSTISHPTSCPRGVPANSLSPNLVSHQTARASPIQEEDEDQLFPLPSPRCTPSPSSSLNIDPSPVPSRSSSNRCTPTPSPNASTSCIASLPSSSVTSPDDSILAQSLSRKTLKLEIPNAAESSSVIPTLILNERTNISDSLSPSIKCPSTLDPAAPPSHSPSSGSTYPKRSPSISQKKRFSLPFFKSGVDVLKGAGTDVIRGVGMGGTMHHVG